MILFLLPDGIAGSEYIWHIKNRNYDAAIGLNALALMIIHTIEMWANHGDNENSYLSKYEIPY